MSNQKIDLEPFLRLFDHLGITLFPRKSMGLASKGQIVVNSLQDLYELVEASDRIDCFMQTHTVEDKAKGLLYLVFIDIDCPGDLKRAKEVFRRVLHYLRVKYGISPYAQFSGSKGYHILIPLEPITVNPPSLTGSFLKFLQLKLSMGYCDHALLGDSVRLCRLPNTFNSKAIKNDQDGLVRIVQEWDGKRLDTGLLWEEFTLKKLDEELSRKEKKPRVKTAAKINGIRPQIFALIEKAKQGINLTHQQRLAVLFELIANGWEDDQILEVFEAQPDFDLNKTRYMIEHARRMGYKPFKTERLQEVFI